MFLKSNRGPASEIVGIWSLNGEYVIRIRFRIGIGNFYCVKNFLTSLELASQSDSINCRTVNLMSGSMSRSSWTRCNKFWSSWVPSSDSGETSDLWIKPLCTQQIISVSRVTESHAILIYRIAASKNSGGWR